ncbi:MAG: integrase/recombinase XerD [Thermoplasmata archaeon]|nr:integrase/recombinase XerD [Thermoplasmata archaeon]
MIEEFRTFLLVDEGKRPITVDRMLRRLERARRVHGLDLAVFVKGAADAEREGRAYLAKRRVEPRSTVFSYNNDVKALNALLRWRKLHREVHFKAHKEPRAQLRTLSRDAIWKLFGYRCASPEAEKMHRALLLVAYVTGARASEVAAMTLSDLDPKRSRIRIAKPAKGGLKRWLPVERWVWSPKRPLAAWLKVRPVPEGESDALWTTTHKSGNGGYAPGAAPARRVTSDYLRVCLYRVGEAVGVKVNFNVLRHTRATHLVRLGWSLLYVRTYLGHTSVKSTEIYAEVHPEDMDKAMQKRPGKDPFTLEGEDEE